MIIVGVLRESSGLGAAARACYDALRASGVEVYGVDLTEELIHQANFADFTFEDGRELVGEGTVFLHVIGRLIPFAMYQLGRNFIRNKRVFAHWFWELPQVSNDWGLGVPFVHEICVNTSFIAEAVRPIAGDRGIHIVPYPLPLSGTFPRSYSHDIAKAADRPFTVLVVFNVASSFARKNPCAAINAFRMAFGNDPSVRLIVKHSNASTWKHALPQLLQTVDGANNIVLNGDLLSAAGMDALYNEADVVLSLHRAEGLGLVLAEAMLRGVPVVATDWSGNRDFLTQETGIPIGYDLVAVDDPQGSYPGNDTLCWAEPHVNEAASALRALRTDPTLRRRFGAAAAEAMRSFDPKFYADEVVRLFTPCEP